VLAIETSVPTARVAILDATGARLAGGEKTAARHSSNLLRLCDEALRAAGLAVAQLGAIACGGGPGSFTGLRVGLAVGKGLALPTGRPFLLVSSLEALARDLRAAAPQGGLFVPCLDAGKDQVYARLFRPGADGALEADSDDWALEPAALAERLRATRSGPVVLGGTGHDRYAALFAEALPDATRLPAVAGPSAEAVGRLALARLRRGDADDLETAVPVYGRPPDITKPKPR
jgi:tRNA threonylcarbamoyladenosine biosynthesis protein TsaB